MSPAALLLALVLSAPPAAGQPQPPAMIEACLANGDMDRDSAGLSVLFRRFPDGRRTRDLSWWPMPKQAAAGVPRGPLLQLVYGIEGARAGPLKQLSIQQVEVFKAGQAATEASFELLLDGVSLGRTPWPEYAAAARSYAASGEPRYVDAEAWLIWDGDGEGLRRMLEEVPRALTVRVVDQAGRILSSAEYDLAKTPIADATAVARLLKNTTDEACPPA